MRSGRTGQALERPAADFHPGLLGQQARLGPRLARLPDPVDQRENEDVPEGVERVAGSVTVGSSDGGLRGGDRLPDGGYFGVPYNYRAGSEPYAVAAVDLNADGRPDLDVTNFQVSTVSVFL